MSVVQERPVELFFESCFATYQYWYPYWRRDWSPGLPRLCPY